MKYAYYGVTELTRKCLKIGDDDPEVKELRTNMAYHFDTPLELQEKILKSEPEGTKFGPLTAKAVEQFQTHHKIGIDGVAGPSTWNKVGSFKVSCVKKSASGKSTPSPSLPMVSQKFYQKKGFKVAMGVGFTGLILAILFAPKGK